MADNENETSQTTPADKEKDNKSNYIKVLLLK